jgi:hypothetical protein
MFDVVVGFMYLGNLEIPSAMKGKDGDSHNNEKYAVLSRVYRTAHFLMMEELQNAIVDEAHKLAKKTVPSYEAARILCAAGLQGSKLMDLYLKMHALALKSAMAMKVLPASMDEVLNEGSGYAGLLLRAVLGGGVVEGFERKGGRGLCGLWHVHETPRDCGY